MTTSTTAPPNPRLPVKQIAKQTIVGVVILEPHTLLMVLVNRLARAMSIVYVHPDATQAVLVVYHKDVLVHLEQPVALMMTVAERVVMMLPKNVVSSGV